MERQTLKYWIVEPSATSASRFILTINEKILWGRIDRYNTAVEYLYNFLNISDSILRCGVFIKNFFQIE